jgi:hypothetical protein
LKLHTDSDAFSAILAFVNETAFQFDGMAGNKALRDAFHSMQNIYVFDEADRLGFDAVSETLSSIKTDLLNEIAQLSLV